MTVKTKYKEVNTMARTVVGVFESYEMAEKAANQIKDRGLRTDDISIVAKSVSDDNDNKGRDGAARGAINDNISDGVVTGGILGGLAGLLIGAGSMVIPGLGIIAAAGPITGLLSGAVTGGIVGGLVDLGIPESKSKQYESELKSGRILFSMRTDDDKVSSISSILYENGAKSVDSY